MNTLAKTNLVNDIFKGSFILSSRRIVESLEAGAIAYGGATQVNNFIFSNIDNGLPIEMRELNTYGIIVPTTINVNETIDNTEYLQYVERKLNIIEDIETYASSGSWYSEDLKEVIIENNNIVTFITDMDPSVVLQYMRLVALNLKDMMAQEGISILVNDGLVIV